MKKSYFWVVLLIVPLILACQAVAIKITPTVKNLAPTATPTTISTSNTDSQTQSDNTHDFEWVNFLGSHTDGSFLYVSDFGISPDGFIYVLQTQKNKQSEKNEDCYLIKINSNGDEQWRTLIATFHAGACSKIVFDKDNNIYISGFHPISWGTSGVPTDKLNGDTDFIAKFDASGTDLQNYFFKGSFLSSYEFAIDPQGAIYLITGDQNGFSLSKMSPSGDIEQKNSYPSQWDYYAERLIVNDSGIIFAMGDVHYWNAKKTTNGDCFLSIISADGKLQSDTIFGSKDGDDNCYENMVFDNNGNVYISGMSNVSWGNPLQPYQGGWQWSNDDPRGYADFIAKFSPSGNLVWNTFTENPRTDTDNVVLDSRNTLIMAVSGIEQMDSSGNLFRVTYFKQDTELYYSGIQIDGQQNIYVLGESYSTLDKTIHIINPSAGEGGGVFIAKVILNR